MFDVYVAVPNCSKILDVKPPKSEDSNAVGDELDPLLYCGIAVS